MTTPFSNLVLVLLFPALVACGGDDAPAGEPAAEVRELAGTASARAETAAEPANPDFGRIELAGGIEHSLRANSGNAAVVTGDDGVRSAAAVLVADEDETVEVVQVGFTLDLPEASPGEEEGTYALLGPEGDMEPGTGMANVMIIPADGGMMIGASTAGGRLVIEGSDRDGVRGTFEFVVAINGRPADAEDIRLAGEFDIPWSPMAGPFDQR